MCDSCSCGSKTSNVKPLKYSPADRFAEYRRKAKIDEYVKRGIL